MPTFEYTAYMSSLILALRENMRRVLNEGRLEEAEEILTRLKLEDPLSQETRGFELELSLDSNRLVEANRLACQLCRLFPQSGRIAFLAGKVAYRLKNYKQAELHFRESNRIYPHWRNQYWLGKTLTQSGHLEEAESLLLEARERTANALLELAWLHERRNELQAALKAYDEFLTIHPDHSFAAEQRLRVRANLLEPESLIDEVGTLAELGEDVPLTLFPEYVQKLFDTGRTLEAREQIIARMGTLDAKTGSRMAWVCYRAKAYDLACTLFLAHLRHNLSYYKYLNALESAAVRSGRMDQLLAAYRSFTAEAPSLHGRLRRLKRLNLPREKT
jgi:tetratricopeptide (TPR) repeat protein